VRTVTLTAATLRHDLADLAARFQAAVDPGRLYQLAHSLGVSPDSLLSLRIGWSADHRAWAFPMGDARGAVLGIRLRRPDGFKFAVKGGHQGLFIQAGLANDNRMSLLIAEGPTDTAALLGAGFPAVAGRPSCTGGVRLLVELVRMRIPRQVVVVADADEAGRRGADDLASILLIYAPAVRVIAPPEGIKDARDWLRSGGNRRAVERAIHAAPVRRLAVRAREVGYGC
jgi:hypothetical protein